MLRAYDWKLSVPREIVLGVLFVCLFVSRIRNTQQKKMEKYSEG